MNILILTATNERHNYFASKIIEAFPNDNISIVREEKRGVKIIGGNFIKRAKRKYNQWIMKCAANLFSGNIKRFLEEKKEIETVFFNEESKNFENNYMHKIKATVRRKESINSLKWIEFIKSIKPDIITVMGTSLLGSEIINISKLASINMHTGLSPYYRGSMTNLWPIINKEVELCGVTIHKLSKGIDSGEIVYHGQPKIDKNDTFATINCKVIIKGTELMIKAITDAIKGTLNSYPQNMKIGRLYFNNQFNDYIVSKYYKIIEKGYINNFANDKILRKDVRLHVNPSS